MECEHLCVGRGVIVCVSTSSVILVMFMASVCVWASVKCHRPCSVRVTIVCVVDVPVALVDVAVVFSLVNVSA